MNDTIKASDNLFLELGFQEHEAEILQLRADLMARLRLWIADNNLTQEQAAVQLGVSQARISDLVRGKWKKFSLDMLLTLAAKAGIRIKVIFEQAA